MYKIYIGNYQVWRRHVDQLRKSEMNNELSRRKSSPLNMSPPNLSEMPVMTEIIDPLLVTGNL
jgi:hypothetical protein